MKRFFSIAMVCALVLMAACNLAAEDEHLGGEDSSASNGEKFEVSGYYTLGEMPDSEVYPCPPQEIAFVTDRSVRQTPESPEPQPRTPFHDPVFGTCIIRVTDRQQDILNLDDPSRGMKNEYARVQSFNADSSLFIVRSIESFWYLYDARSLLPLGEVPVALEPRWDSSDPFLLYYIDESRLKSYDLRTGKVRSVRDFAREFPGVEIAAVWTRYEGSPSYNSRFWGLLVQNADWDPVAFLIYDLEEDRVVIRDIPAGYSIDNVTISPLGNYFLASFDEYCPPGEIGSAENPCGLMVYDSSLENGRSLLRIIGHYDSVLDAQGREVILYQDIDTDHISMLELESGEITPILSIDFSHTAIGFHFSGRASDLPGWALVSTYNGGHPADFTWMDDSIFAVELRENGRVVRLAHTQSRYDEDMEQDYWAEPHASVNQDFTRVVFTSNWGRSGTEEVDMYMIILPENWTELPP
ncbi:MAG: hypothetical protein PVI99_00145 [Anaerolineales bacterium]|jgi:hypothetical protein